MAWSSYLSGIVNHNLGLQIFKKGNYMKQNKESMVKDHCCLLLWHLMFRLFLIFSLSGFSFVSGVKKQFRMLNLIIIFFIVFIWQTWPHHYRNGKVTGS